MRRALLKLAVIILAVGGCTAFAAAETRDEPASGDGGSTIARQGGGGGAPPCPALITEGIDVEEVGGGCRLEASSEEIDLLVNSVIGKFRFERCILNYELYVDAAGRTRMHHVQIGGPTPCNDVHQCSTGPDEVVLPWRGRIRAVGDGTFRHTVRACFDSCIGRFEGRLVTVLSPTARGWRAEAQAAGVGMSGLQLDGAWKVRGRLALDAPAED